MSTAIASLESFFFLLFFCELLPSRIEALLCCVVIPTLCCDFIILHVYRHISQQLPVGFSWKFQKMFFLTLGTKCTKIIFFKIFFLDNFSRVDFLVNYRSDVVHTWKNHSIGGLYVRYRWNFPKYCVKLLFCIYKTTGPIETKFWLFGAGYPVN